MAGWLSSTLRNSRGMQLQTQWRVLVTMTLPTPLETYALQVYNTYSNTYILCISFSPSSPSQDSFLFKYHMIYLKQCSTGITHLPYLLTKQRKVEKTAPTFTNCYKHPHLMIHTHTKYISICSRTEHRIVKRIRTSIY